MIYTILIVVQVIIALGLIALILLQHGKGADAGAAFGSGASGTVFGAKGTANFMSRATAVLATLFFLSSLTLAYIVNGGGAAAGTGSVTDQLTNSPAAQQAPAGGNAAPQGNADQKSGAGTPSTGDSSNNDQSNGPEIPD